MKKRVLFLVNNLVLGGLEKVNVTIVNELSNTENITLYSFKGNDFGYQLNSKVKYICGGKRYTNYLRHPILTFKALKTNNLYDKKMINFKQIEKDLNFREYDFVVLSEADILFSKEILKINPDIEIISWLHNDFASYKNFYFKDCYTQFIENLSLANSVVTLTENDRRKYLPLLSQVVQINNPLTAPVNRNYSRNNASRKLSFVGRLEYKQKGLTYLIELSRLIPSDWIISVAGDGIDAERFKQEIKDNNLCDKFEFKGALRGDTLAKHYLDSSIFILTSRWEGFGLVITEAMSYGVPVVAFDTVGSREIIGEDNNFGFLIENGDTESMAQKINLLIDNEDLRRKYSERSLMRSKNYSLEYIAMKWKNLFKE